MHQFAKYDIERLWYGLLLVTTPSNLTIMLRDDTVKWALHGYWFFAPTTDQ
jgi:hypothetical protein